MPDRTKHGRSPNKNLGSHWTTSGEPPRTDFDQVTKIDAEWGDHQLESIGPISSVENQYAGPTAVHKVYRPTGKGEVTRPGLDDGDALSRPTPTKPRI